MRNNGEQVLVAFGEDFSLSYYLSCVLNCDFTSISFSTLCGSVRLRDREHFRSLIRHLVLFLFFSKYSSGLYYTPENAISVVCYSSVDWSFLLQRLSANIIFLRLSRNGTPRCLF